MKTAQAMPLRVHDLVGHEGHLNRLLQFLMTTFSTGKSNDLCKATQQLQGSRRDLKGRLWGSVGHLLSIEYEEGLVMLALFVEQIVKLFL